MKARPGRKKGSPGAVKPDSEKKLHITRLGLNDLDRDLLESRLADLKEKGQKVSRAGYFRKLFLNDIKSFLESVQE